MLTTQLFEIDNKATHRLYMQDDCYSLRPKCMNVIVHILVGGKSNLNDIAAGDRRKISSGKYRPR